MTSELEKRMKDLLQNEEFHDVMTIVAEAKKEFPDNSVGVFKFAIAVEKWFAKWFGAAEEEKT